MKLYILRSDGAYVSFEGMTQEDITVMLDQQGFSCNFIDNETYSTAINSLQHII